MDGNSGAGTPSQRSAGRALARVGKGGMAGSGVLAGIGALVLGVGILILQAAGSAMDGMQGLVMWPFMLVAILLVAAGGIALGYGLIGLILSRLGIAVGRALEQDRPGSRPAAVILASLAVLGSAGAAIGALADGQLPVVPVVIGFLAARFLLSLRGKASSGSLPEETS